MNPSAVSVVISSSLFVFLTVVAVVSAIFTTKYKQMMAKIELLEDTKKLMERECLELKAELNLVANLSKITTLEPPIKTRKKKEKK